MRQNTPFRTCFPYAFHCLARIARGLLAGAMVVGLSVGAATVSTGCSQTPPPKWQQGGAPIVLQPAVWERQTHFVQVQNNGHVILNDRLMFVLDRNGRVHDALGDPYAVLEAGNRLSGNNDWTLGTISVSTATPPGSSQPWITVFPSGKVVRQDMEGRSFEDGAWSGCNGQMMRTCTLVSHLIVLYEQMYSNQQQHVGGPQQGPVVEPADL